MPENCLFSHHAEAPVLAPLDWAYDGWTRLDDWVRLERSWDGTLVGGEREGWLNTTQVSSLWNEDHVFFSFECGFDKLTVRADLGEDGPIDALWDYDVVEVFLRPGIVPDYFEFEVSPLGQWLDAHIEKPRTLVHFGWGSNLRCRVRLLRDRGIWQTRLAIPYAPMLNACQWKAVPQVGSVWRLNLFRMTGTAANREYICWQPTLTATPDFHVPAAFGSVVFL